MSTIQNVNEAMTFESDTNPHTNAFGPRGGAEGFRAPKIIIWQDGPTVSELAMRVVQAQEWTPPSCSAGGLRGGGERGQQCGQGARHGQSPHPGPLPPSGAGFRTTLCAIINIPASEGGIKFTVLFLFVLLESRKTVYRRASVPAEEHTRTCCTGKWYGFPESGLSKFMPSKL